MVLDSIYSPPVVSGLLDQPRGEYTVNRPNRHPPQSGNGLPPFGEGRSGARRDRTAEVGSSHGWRPLSTGERRCPRRPGEASRWRGSRGVSDNIGRCDGSDTPTDLAPTGPRLSSGSL